MSFNFFTPLPTLATLCLIIAILEGIKWYLVVFLICIFLFINGIVFIDHLDSFLWRNVYSKLLSIFKLSGLSFYCWVVCILCMFCIFLSVMWFTDIVFHHMACEAFFFFFSFWLCSAACDWASQVVLVVKNPLANAGDARNVGLIPGSGRFPWGGNGNPLHYSSLANPLDTGSYLATVHGITKSQTQRCTHVWLEGS